LIAKKEPAAEKPNKASTIINPITRTDVIRVRIPCLYLCSSDSCGRASSGPADWPGSFLFAFIPKIAPRPARQHHTSAYSLLSRILINVTVSIATFRHRHTERQEKWAISCLDKWIRLLNGKDQEKTSSPTGGLGVANKLTWAWRIASARPGSKGTGAAA